MNDANTAIALVTATFALLLGTVAVIVRVLWRENRRLTNEVLLGYRRATMPVVQVPMDGEPDVPLTVEGKRVIDAALGIFNDGVVDDGQAWVTVSQAFTAAGYPDPTDAAFPDPDLMDGANRVSYGDDPSWPVQGQS